MKRLAGLSSFPQLLRTLILWTKNTCSEVVLAGGPSQELKSAVLKA